VKPHGAYAQPSNITTRKNWLGAEVNEDSPAIKCLHCAAAATTTTTTTMAATEQRLSYGNETSGLL